MPSFIAGDVVARPGRWRLASHLKMPSSRCAVANRFEATIALVIETAAREGFRAALIGGFAMPFLGITRATGDVDFLVEAVGAEALHAALCGAGFEAVHRTENVANYVAPGPELAPVDVLFARRPATLGMLARATPKPLASGDAAGVLVIDAEGIIGLKVQAIANDPARRLQDEADIVRLLRVQGGALDHELIASYFHAFGMEADLERLRGEVDAK